MPLANLQLTDVGPFKDISFEFDPQVNVFTGPNNSGKSTALWVLGELLVYPFTLPSKVVQSDSARWRITFPIAEVGLQYLKGRLPVDPLELKSLNESVGYTCFIPAQRQSTGFRPTGPSVGEDTESRVDQELEMILQERPTALAQLGAEELRRRVREYRRMDDPVWEKRRRLMLSDTLAVTDREVLQKFVNLDYASYRTGNPRIKNVIQEVFSIAGEITEGFPLEYQGIEANDSEGGLYLELDTIYGKLPLDYLSQGTQSIIQCLARFLLGYAEFYEFPENLREKPAILIIDEIDAHLHPTWQRRFVPTLNRHFPNLQIFCSTHAPLLLAGLKEGQVQLLKFDKHGKLSVSSNNEDIVGWSADEILRDFLNVPNPTDLGTDGSINRLKELRAKADLNAEESEELDELRRVVGQALLEGPVSGLIERFAEDIKRVKE